MSRHTTFVDAVGRGNGRYTYSYTCSCGARGGNYKRRSLADEAGKKHEQARKR